MAYNHEYPYFSADNANVDWFLDFVNRLHKEWEDMKKEWNDVLTEWDGMKNTWEEYRQELENRFGEFTTNITNQFGALRLEFTDLKQEFNALKIYVETQINNLPDEVKNIFQTYIDNGTVLEMITTLLPDIPADLTEQVEKNKNDIAVLTTSLATLTNTVNGHTTTIAELVTKVNQNTTDIADINTLDTEQNNRLTALENRNVSTQEHFWLLIGATLPNLANYITNVLGSAFFETTTLTTGLGDAKNIINGTKPNKTPTRIIIIPANANISTDPSNSLTLLSDIANICMRKYPSTHVYFAAGPSPTGSVNSIGKMCDMLNRIKGYSAIIRNPFIHLCMRPVLASYPLLQKNGDGDFISTHKIAYHYVGELFNSMFAPQFGDSNIVYKLPINIVLGTDSGSIGHMVVILHNSYCEVNLNVEMPGSTNRSIDIAGREGETVIGNISGNYFHYVPRFIPTMSGVLSFFSRDNVSSGSHACMISFNNLSSQTNISVTNMDFNAVSIVNGYTLIARKFFDWAGTNPINE